MAAATDCREEIAAALANFRNYPLAEAAKRLFKALGYNSDRHLPISTAKQFREQLDPENRLTAREGEALDKLSSLHLLFQLTGTELEAHRDLLDDATAFNQPRLNPISFSLLNYRQANTPARRWLLSSARLTSLCRCQHSSFSITVTLFRLASFTAACTNATQAKMSLRRLL